MAFTPIPKPLPTIITRKTPGGGRISVIDPITGIKLKRVTAVNIEEGWIEESPEWNSLGGVEGLVKTEAKRRYCDFDLRDILTGELLARVRKTDNK